MFSNSYGATYQNMMVVVQQMIDEAIRSREIKETVEKQGSESEGVDLSETRYLSTLVSIKDKLEGTPNVTLLREDPEDEELLTKVVLTYPSQYYSSYNLLYNNFRESVVKVTRQITGVVFTIYSNEDEQVLSFSIGLNYNNRGQLESVIVNDGSWE